MTPEHLISLGRIVNVHATRGEVRLLPYNSESTTLKKGSSIVLQRGSELLQQCVVAIRPHKNFLLLTLEGCSTMNAAQALVGSEVCIDEADLPPLDAGEVYHYQLVGMCVADLNGTVVGTVHEVLAFGGADVCVVRDGKREVMVPLVSAIVREIDPIGRRIVVDPPAGLFDL